jgi:hypothetical protein
VAGQGSLIFPALAAPKLASLSIAVGAQTLVEQLLVNVAARGHGLHPTFIGRRAIYSALGMIAGT